MEIVTLIENTCPDHDLKAEHGLSLYIKTAQHSLLFDSDAT